MQQPKQKRRRDRDRSESQVPALGPSSGPTTGTIAVPSSYRRTMSVDARKKSSLLMSR